MLRAYPHLDRHSGATAHPITSQWLTSQQNSGSPHSGTPALTERDIHVEIIDKRIEAFAAKYCDLYPAAMRILLTDKAGLTAYLRFPVEHHGRVRHSNLIERSFGETKRRTKVIGRFPGETSAISLVWAVLDRASTGWRGLTMTPVGTRLLQDLRRSLLDPPRELRPPPSATSGDTDPADPISATA